MNRRQYLKLSCVAAAGIFARGAVPELRGSRVALPPEGSRRLFFELRDVARIREVSRSMLLGETFRQWRATAREDLATAWRAFERSGDIVFDLSRVWSAFTRLATVHLIEPSPERERALLESIRKVVALEQWDYFQDGDVPIGIMRSSMAVSRLLFAREVLGESIDEDLERDLLRALAEKGVVPCYRTLMGMNSPESVRGWQFAPGQNPYHDIDLHRWPLILGSNNLRAIPTMAVGLGALALDGVDQRSGEWLHIAEESAMKVFGLFSEDGSFFEGLSYANYTLRTLLQFCGAHRRINGSVNWTQAMNFDGFIEFVAAMQAGRNADGSPDIVNFSDARTSVFPCVPAWIAEHTENPRAQYVAEHFSAPGYFLDFLWFQPQRGARMMPVRLENYRSDLDWIVCRSGWESRDAVLAFRSGFPANHEHADRNSFFYKVYGERLLTDHFGAAYNRLDPGWCLRLTKAHNAVLIDGHGQQYHEGEEGTNAGKSRARIVRFDDRGRRVWWSSDATDAYRLVNPKVVRVVRTVAFAKPDIVVVLDEIETKTPGAQVEVRYFPDNRDGAAEIDVASGAFVIRRPGAELFGAVLADGEFTTTRQVLDPSEDPPPSSAGAGAYSREQLAAFGEYPFIRIAAGDSRERHAIVTAMVARPGRENERPSISVERTADGWRFAVAGVDGFFAHTDNGTVVLW